jgi:hypothetical protein
MAWLVMPPRGVAAVAAVVQVVTLCSTNRTASAPTDRLHTFMRLGAGFANGGQELAVPRFAGEAS